MSAITVDDSGWPLVRILIDGEQTDEDVTGFLAALDRLLERDQPYFALAEVRHYFSNISHIKQLATWTLQNAAKARTAVAGVALVIPSDRFRFMLSSFVLVTPMPCPFHSTTDVVEAEAWIHELAEKNGAVNVV